MRAIVVDDSRAMRGILKRILTGMGFEVTEAGDGQDALNAFGRMPGGSAPDLALVDWNMPNINGYEFVVWALRDPALRDMRIVMVTTEVETGQIDSALRAGADEYVMEPFTPEAMREKLALLGFAREAA